MIRRMKEAERKSLVEKILKAGTDAKGARVALSVFLNSAGADEARVFLQYLDSNDAAQKKMARLVVGHFGLSEAIDSLLSEVQRTIGPLTFLPDAEFREAVFYPNLVEIFETLYAILKSSGQANDQLLALAEDVFKKTTSEDLRFTLIKLIGLLGDRFDYLFAMHGKMSEKERRALYHVYAARPHPRRGELFRLGLGDEANFEFVVANAVKFPEGRALLNEQLPLLPGAARLAALKKLEGEDVGDLVPALMKLLRDESKLVVELAADLLKASLRPGDSLDPFLAFMQTPSPPDMVRAAMDIVEHLHPERLRAVLVDAFERQPGIHNRNLIGDRLLKLLRADPAGDGAYSQRLLSLLLPLFDQYTADREELLATTCRILPLLHFTSSTQVKTVRKKVIDLRDRVEGQLSPTIRHILSEALAKFNQLIARLEESEARLKKILLLYDIDPARIDGERVVKLKEQLLEIEQVDDESRQRLCGFLSTLVSTAGDDWKKKSASVDLLGVYGDESHLPQLAELAAGDASLAVKVGAQKAGQTLRQRLGIPAEGVLVAEPLPYLAKLLIDFFAARPWPPRQVRSAAEFSALGDAPFRFLFVSETVFDGPEGVFSAYLRRHPDCRGFLLVSDPETAREKAAAGFQPLVKPFNQQTLDALVAP